MPRFNSRDGLGLRFARISLAAVRLEWRERPSEEWKVGMDQAENWVTLPCPLCGSAEFDPAYERVHETGSTLGRFRKVDVLCRDCGFMYTNPRPSAEQMRHYYSDASSASGSVYHSLAHGSRLPDLTIERAQFIASRVAAHVPAQHGRLLDIGCSFGDLLSELNLPGWQKVGLEPSSSATQIARDRGLDVFDGDIETTGIASEAYDVVVCISALEHVWDLPLALEKISKAVKPEGLVFIEVPDSLRPIAQIAEFYSFEHFSHFTENTLSRALREVGLAPIAFDQEVSIPNLRVCAKASPAVASARIDASEQRQELLDALDRYRAERQSFERQIVERLVGRAACWKQEGARVAIHGAGMHTRFLLDLIDLAPSICCVLDNDPQKAGQRFLNWEVHPPSAIAELGLDAILISTNAFEDEVFAATEPVARKLGIEVVRCYG